MIMTFDEFFEKVVYSEACKEMNSEGRSKLSNWLAHGYAIESTRQLVILERGEQTIMLDKDGNIWKAQKAV